MKRNNREMFPFRLPFLRYQPYQPCRQPDFPFAHSGLWRIFRIVLQDSRFAFHSSHIVTYAQVQRWRHSRMGVFFSLHIGLWPGCVPLCWQVSVSGWFYFRVSISIRGFSTGFASVHMFSCALDLPGLRKRAWWCPLLNLTHSQFPSLLLPPRIRTIPTFEAWQQCPGVRLSSSCAQFSGA